MQNVHVYWYRDSMCFKDLFYCFIHYNLVTSDDIGLEFHQRFEMPTVVFAMVHSCIKFKCIANDKSKSCQISHRKKNPCKSFILKIVLILWPVWVIERWWCYFWFVNIKKYLNSTSLSIVSNWVENHPFFYKII